MSRIKVKKKRSGETKIQHQQMLEQDPISNAYAIRSVFNKILLQVDMVLKYLYKIQQISGLDIVMLE